MPRAVRGTTQEREQYMFEVFKDWYSDPKNAGKDLSVAKANEVFRQKFGSMLRNKRAYEIRRSAKAQAGVAEVSRQTVTATRGEALVPAGSSQAACLVTGTPEQIAWLREQVLPKLRESGLARAKVDHSTEAYVVLAQ